MDIYEMELSSVTSPETVGEYAHRMTITPTLAVAWLDRTTLRNRTIDRHKLAKYTRELRNGTFLCNGETLILDPDGQVLDGQHRLHAVILADVPLVAWVIFGMPPEVFASLGQGKVRSMANVLDIAGENYYTRLASSLMWIWRHDHGLMDNTSPDHLPDRSDLLFTLGQHPGLRASLAWGMKLNFLMPPSLSIACHYLFAQQDALLADEFFIGLQDGLNLLRTSPIYVLRQRLLRQRQSKARLPTIEVAAVTIKAWNACVERRDVRSLRWITEGKTPEPFPTITGPGRPLRKHRAWAQVAAEVTL